MTIQQIKNKIPHGGLKEIAKRCKVHYITVISFFDGKKPVSERTRAKILTHTAEYLKELKQQQKKATKILNNL